MKGGIPTIRGALEIEHPNPNARPGATWVTFEQDALERRAAKGKQGAVTRHEMKRAAGAGWSKWSQRNVALFRAFCDSDDRFVRFIEGQFEAAMAEPNGAAAGRIFERVYPGRLATRIGEMAAGDATGEATDHQLGKRLLGELERRLTTVVGADVLQGLEDGDQEPDAEV